MFQEEGWSSRTQLMRTFIVLVLFGFAALPVTFIASMLFSIPSSGFTRMAIINVFTGKWSMKLDTLRNCVECFF